MSSARQDFSTFVKGTRKLFRKGESLHESGDEDAGNGEEGLPTAKYEYTELAGANSTRLIALQPGRRSDTIVCQLREISLDESAEYDTLSYVWGPPSRETIGIQVDDGRLEIGPGLHCALKYLRYTDRPRVLWADAICINQANISERNIQVPLMREIYQNAACTVCFLGPTVKKTRSLYAMLEELAKEKMAMEADDSIYSVTDDTVPAIVNYLPVQPIKTKLFDKYVGDSTIVEIAKCRWWLRAWTVQELILSTNAVMMTGTYTITWEKLCAAVDHGFNMQIWGPVFLGFSINPVVVPYLSMKALMSRFHHPHQQVSPALDLFHLLVNCRHRESTDPRDKIYALLGLLRARHPETLKAGSSDALDVEMDYSHDVDYVYRKMSQELILKMQSLDVLGICPKTTRSLPSWVTDWSVTDRIGSSLMQDSLDRPRVTHAAKHTKVNALFSAYGTTMFISGYELTSVAALVEPLPVTALKNTADNDVSPDVFGPLPDLGALNPNTERGYSFCKALKLVKAIMKFLWHVLITTVKLQIDWFAHDLRQLMAVFHTLFAWERFAGAEPRTNPGGDPDAVYWQTLCGGTYKNGSIDETGLIFRTWSDLVQPLRKFTAKHSRIVEKYPLVGIAIYMRSTWHSYGEFWPYMACSQHRRLGRAANGWLCLLPKETNVGDVIVLAKGGRVPLVMRPGKDGRSTFVGEAYVHGIMDGEAFDEEKCVDIEIE